MIRSGPAKLALALAWLITVAVTLVAPAAPALAATPQLTVRLNGLTVTGKPADQSVVLTGTVTNSGAQPAFGVRVVLWRSRDAISDAAAFRSVLSGESSPWGERLNRNPEHSQWITDPSVAFNPGTSADFTVRGTLADLGFTSPGAVHLLGVQVLGTADGSTDFVELARTGTFFVVPPEDDLPLTSLVLLSAVPTKVQPDLFVNESLVGELTGRLDTLVGLAARGNVSWLVDPALIDEVTDMADGYSVVDGEGTRAGTGEQAAAAWLERFRELSTDHGARTLFGSPDVLGAQQYNEPRVVDWATQAMSADTLAKLDALPLLVLPHAGVAGATTPAFVASAEPEALLVRNAGRGPVITAGPDGSTLLRLAPAAGAAGPGNENGPVQREQRQYAEAVLGHGLLRLITTPAQASADAATTPGWLRRTTIDDLLDTRQGAQATLTLPARPTTLSAPRFHQLQVMSDDFDRYRDLVPQSAIASDAPATLARMASTSWIRNPATGSWIAAVSDPISQSTVNTNVTVSASPRVLMSSRANEFPVTVSNRLTEQIQVRIVFSSDNPQRLKIPPTDLIRVAPGQNLTVNVRPEATSNGLVNVTASLQTGSGQPVGRPTRIAVEVTDLGTIGWIMVIVSGIVLVAATALRIRQVRRKQKEEEA